IAENGVRLHAAQFELLPAKREEQSDSDGNHSRDNVPPYDHGTKTESSDRAEQYNGVHDGGCEEESHAHRRGKPLGVQLAHNRHHAALTNRKYEAYKRA